MAAIHKRKLKQRVNISIDESLKARCSNYAKNRYNTSLSAVITALLTDWDNSESKKKASHPGQGELI